MGLVLAAGALAVAAATAGSAFADDHSEDADTPRSGTETAGGFSPANDITPGGVPVFGLLESVSKAPDRLSPEKGQ